jgi:hypothetical protein
MALKVELPRWFRRPPVGCRKFGPSAWAHLHDVNQLEDFKALIAMINI